MPLGIEVDLWPNGRPGDFVLDGDPDLPRKKGYSPQFSAYVYCGQTARWIKMQLGKEVDLGPGDIVLDGAQPLSYGPCLLWPKRSPISATAELL